MSIQGPIGKENQNIAFRLRSKTQLFDGSSNPFQNVNCSNVASASCYGLVFMASAKPELVIVCLKDLEREKATVLTPATRTFTLPSPAYHIAVNCDSSILAAAVKINGVPHLQLYSVQSFLTPNIQKLRETRLSNDNSDAIQLCWNPVMNGTLAVCTATGQLNMFTVKDTGLELHGIDPNFKAKCCCWSPKGKQIVVGFANGKLAQFHPDLKPAKLIDCPPGIMPGTFDTISVQWLSTFQFAAAFLSHEQNSRPILHIINAPKAGPTQYIAYSDVCYSASETRPSKVYLNHIIPWNMLIIASANSLDVSFLRVTQVGDIPVWTQEFPNDMFPAELPLTASKEESFPVGFDLDLGCSTKVVGDDSNLYPVMPMLHIMSTEGVLCSFYLMNTLPTYVDICSPARPIDSASLSLFQVQEQKKTEVSKTPPNSEISFASPISQSTPAIAKVQPKPTFGITQPATTAPPFGATMPFSMPTTATSQPSLTFGNIQQPTTTFGSTQPPSLSFGSQPAKQFNIPQTVENVTFGQTPPSSQPSTLTVKPVAQQPPVQKPSQPLITVPPTFNPQANSNVVPETKSSATSSSEDDLIFSNMIKDEMKAFELEMQAVLSKSRSLKLNIGTKEESSDMRKKLEELDELKKEATETVESLRSDVQMNRLGMTEMFSMFYEAQAKSEQLNNEKSIFLHHSVTKNHGNKRVIDRLINQLSLNEMQLSAASQALCAQWSNYQEEMKKKKKNRMLNPCMEELYNTLTKNQEIIFQQSKKIALLKLKLGIKEGNSRVKNLENSTLDKLSDSIISMSLVEQVENENSKLTGKKLKNLRNLLESRETTIIKPQRPDRPGLNSEIIREKKLNAIKMMKKPEKKIETPSPSIARPVPTINQQPISTKTVPKQNFAFNQPDAPKPIPVAVNLKTSEQSSNPPAFAFATSSNPISFGSQQKTETTSKPIANAFSLSSSTSQAFSLGSGTTAAPSFSFGSSSVFGLDFKKDEPKPVEPSKLAQALSSEKTNVAVSATFSIPMANKVVTPVVAPVKEPQKVTKEDSKSDTPSFTFKLPSAGRKEETVSGSATIKSAAPTFGNVSSSSDTSKAFSFSSAGGASNAFSMSSPANPPTFALNLSSSTQSSTASPAATKPIISTIPAVSKPSTTSSPATVTAVSKPSTPFSGFGSLPSTTTAQSSPFSGTGFSLGTDSSSTGLKLGSTPSTTTTETKPALSSASEALKTTSAFSFGSAFSLSTSTTSTTTPLTTTTASTASSFSFGGFGSSLTTSTAATSTATSTTKTDTFSFSSALPSVTTSAAIPTTVSSLPTFGSANLTPPTEAVSPTIAKVATSESSTKQSDPLQGLNICSPSDPKPASATPSNIFSSAAQTFGTPKTETSSIFGNSSFGSAFGGAAKTDTSQPSIFGTTTTPTVSTQQTVFGATSPSVTTQASIFGQTTTSSVSSPSIFGSSALSGAGDAKTAVSPSQTSSPFALVKPDQSVFGASATPLSPPTSPFASGTSTFGNTSSTGIFGGASATSNVFGSPQTAKQQTPSGGLFAAAAASQATFGQTTGLFSQSNFTSPTTASSNVFGGNASFSSPAGSTNIFAQAAQNPQAPSSGLFSSQSTFGQSATSGGSIFGGSSTAASSPFGSASVFGGANTSGGGAFSSGFGSVTQSGFGSPSSGGSIFGQQQQQPAFGGGAVFGNKPSIFGQATSPQSTGQTNSMFEQLGSQQTGNNLFGGLSQQTQPAQQQPGGFSGSAFSSWR